MMELIKILGPFGLILDIAGAYLIFKFGLPEEISRTGSGFLVIAGENPEEIAKAKKYDKFSKIGFYLLIFGFVFQLISSIKSMYDE